MYELSWFIQKLDAEEPMDTGVGKAVTLGTGLYPTAKPGEMWTAPTPRKSFTGRIPKKSKVISSALANRIANRHAGLS